MAGIKIVDLPALGRDLAATDLLELSLAGGTGSRKITGQEIINASKLNVGTTPIINGTAGRLLFQGTGDILQQSGNLFWDNTNGRLGIGGTPGAFNLDVVGSARTLGTSQIRSSSGSVLGSNLTTTAAAIFYNNGFSGVVGVGSYANSGGEIQSAQNGGLSVGGFLTLQRQGGNVLIGTATDAGFKLDVNGTARTSQLHTFSQGTYLDALTTSSFHSVDTGTGTYGGVSLKNSINNYNGLIYTGRSGASNSIVFEHTTYSGTPSANGSQIFSQTSTTFGKFNNGTYGHTLYIHQRLGSAISYPLVISNGINSTNSGVGILMQTSDSTGAATINHASITSVKQNLATSTVTSDLRFSTITDSANTLSEKMRISNSGNLLINTTTDAGFRLDVNGTARVSGDITTGGSQGILIGISGSGITAISNSVQINSFGANGTANSFYWGLKNSFDQSLANNNLHTYAASITYGSGTHNATMLNIIPTINTGGGTTNVRGIYYNPTLTSMTGVTHFAFHSTSGRVRFEGLPTSPTGLNAGDIYNDGGILKIV